MKRVLLWGGIESNNTEWKAVEGDGVFLSCLASQVFFPQKRRLEGSGINRARDPKLHHHNFQIKTVFCRTRYERRRRWLKRRYISVHDSQ